MKKIALIEDRYKRQNDFLTQNGIELRKYSDVLDNFTEEKAEHILEDIINGNLNNLKCYDIIICHKSVEYQNANTAILSNLKKYCTEYHKTLILFSGGISVNYYDNSEFELLELNSKTFYSRNLKLFLDAVKIEDDNILMLCYGENWKLNVVSNMLEKTNYLIEQVEDDKILYSEFSEFVEIEKLSKIDYEFFSVDIKNRINISEIISFRNTLLNYIKNGNKVKSREHNNYYSLKIDNNSKIIDINFDDELDFTTIDDIDKYISTDILLELKSKQFDVIFIKDNLSSNYLELYGLRVAYHIRLSSELGDKMFVPIVIISDFDEATLNKFTPEANILFTDGIYLCKNSQEDIHKYQSLELNGVSDYDTFLSKIEVRPPKDTTGSHDIANQWSIYRWAKFLGANSDAIEKNKNEVEHELYFKYLVALNPIMETFINNQEVIEPGVQPPQARTGGVKVVKKVEKPLQKILYIDDEFAKGWKDVFQSYFEKKHKQNFQFTILEEITKDTKYDELENYTVDYIKKDIPDLVILDMRLTKEDHEEQNEKNLSGIKLLKYIKEEINPGIQVILLTASGKSKILNEANKYDILGYIKKEHPHDTTIDTKSTFDKLKELIDEGLEKQYLKDIWQIQQDILKLNIFSNDQYHEIKLEVKSVFEILNTKMENRFIYSMFAIFKVLEILVKSFIEEKNENRIRYAYWVNTNSKIPIVNDNNILVDAQSGDNNTSTENKIRVLLHNKLELKDSTIHENIKIITRIRNHTIHPKNKNNDEKIDKAKVSKWFTMLHVILEKFSLNTRN